MLFNFNIWILCLFPPPAFRQWIVLSLGLCSKELFGGPRKFFFTLNWISMRRIRSKFFVFILSAVFAIQCDDELYKPSILGVVYTPREPRKEGRQR